MNTSKNTTNTIDKIVSKLPPEARATYYMNIGSIELMLESAKVAFYENIREYSSQSTKKEKDIADKFGLDEETQMQLKIKRLYNDMNGHASYFAELHKLPLEVQIEALESDANWHIDLDGYDEKYMKSPLLSKETKKKLTIKSIPRIAISKSFDWVDKLMKEHNISMDDSELREGIMDAYEHILNEDWTYGLGIGQSQRKISIAVDIAEHFCLGAHLVSIAKQRYLQKLKPEDAGIYLLERGESEETYKPYFVFALKKKLEKKDDSYFDEKLKEVIEKIKLSEEEVTEIVKQHISPVNDFWKYKTYLRMLPGLREISQKRWDELAKPQFDELMKNADDDALNYSKEMKLSKKFIREAEIQYVESQIKIQPDNALNYALNHNLPKRLIYSAMMQDTHAFRNDWDYEKFRKAMEDSNFNSAQKKRVAEKLIDIELTRGSISRAYKVATQYSSPREQQLKEVFDTMKVEK
jgi:hypothetical protein